MPKTSKPSNKLAKLKKIKLPSQEWPVWTGPCGEGDNGGITQGMLGKFLCDRERFGLRYLDGWKGHEGFSHRLEYGNMWHLCEEKHGEGKNWTLPLQQYADDLLKRYPTNGVDIGKYFNSCLTQFPAYLDFWNRHPDTEIQRSVFREQKFDIQYQLPSGRTVRLRGKWDGGNEVADGLELQENKAKGKIDERAIRLQLRWDLQTMTYIIALKQHLHEQGDDTPVVGVLYNVIKRPFSSGKGNIKPSEGTKGTKCSKCKGTGWTQESGPGSCQKCRGSGRVDAKPPEEPEAFWKRLEKYFVEEPGDWFARWHVKVSDKDCQTFARNCLDPLLENVCDWYGCMTQCQPKGKRSYRCEVHGNIHFQTPLGVWNPLMDGRETEYDGMLEDGRTIGLERNTLIFPELQ